jgi:hypothetical protein
MNCAPGWFYLQDYIKMHGKQNIKLTSADYFFLYHIKMYWHIRVFSGREGKFLFL